MRVRDYLGISRRRQKQLTNAMELSLIGLLFIGLDRGNTGIIVNSAVALGVTRLPAVLERDYGIPMDAGLTLWITSAAFLHALGTVGVPGTELSFYRSVWWWDHLTHGLSASVVAATGYATVRALDEHSEDIYLPRRFTFVFVVMFVLAFGVFWEVVEFALGGIGSVLGGDAPLTQYGLEDTMKDLLFNTGGAIVVGIWGTAHLSDVVAALESRLDGRSDSE